MRFLLTGATGFLGKKVLAGLLALPDTEAIFVISRNKASHPDPRVTLLPLDLSDPSFASDPLPETDRVVHLAGLYDFNEDFRASYRDNVLSALNLIHWIKQSRQNPLVVIASSYAVRYNSSLATTPAETALHQTPPRSNPYPHTKALSEKLFTESGLPVVALRYGVLTGDSRTGLIERINGPYYLMQTLHKMRTLPLPPRLPVPIPAAADAIIPLVPVDAAAKVTLQALQKYGNDLRDPVILEIYDPHSVLVREFCREAFSRILPSLKPHFVRRLPAAILEHQHRLTGIPNEIFNFSIRPVPLSNPRFQRDFPDSPIPSFEGYKETFFKGFFEYISGVPHE